MSTISDIFDSYHDALDGSRERYQSLYTERAENARKFYEAFFKDLIIPFRDRFAVASVQRSVIRLAERFFETSQIDFVAIDGTSQKDAFNDFMVFFGGAYGAKGRIYLEAEPQPKVKYEKWEMNKDVSMVAWIPIPFAELTDLSGEPQEETFLTSDRDNVSLVNIQNHLMQLAEIYLAYNVASSSTIDAPNLIMLDNSLSSIFASTAHSSDGILEGFEYQGRNFSRIDQIIALSHPFNQGLSTPSTKRFQRYQSVIRVFSEEDAERLETSFLCEKLNLTEQELNEAVEYLRKNGVCTKGPNGSISVTRNVKHSWDYTLGIFRSICKVLFIDKKQSALMYKAIDQENPSEKFERWMSPADINFLIAVGLRALIEECWFKKILLVGRGCQIFRVNGLYLQTQ